MFDFRGGTYRTLEGAYQAHRALTYQRGYEHLSGGQAWARGARLGIPHRPEVLRCAVRARFADLPAFRDAIGAHRGPFRVWHQEGRIGRLLEMLYAQLREGERGAQACLPLDSPNPEKLA
jgi:hypothetical protein